MNDFKEILDGLKNIIKIDDTKKGNTGAKRQTS